MMEKIARFIQEQDPPTPFLVVDLDVVADRYEQMRRHLPAAEIFYAVKANTEGEAINYALRTPHDGKPAGPAVLAGPTCDSVDILYQRQGYEMPLDLAIGDRVQFLSTGAYTTTYASVGFNGFDPLPAYYI